jgi:hypothetical protein
MIGAGFSSVSSYVEVSPALGYVPVKNLHVAARLTYIYNSRLVQTGSNPYQEDRINLHHYGIAGFARYIFFKGIFAQLEYEYLSFDDGYYDPYNNFERVSNRIPISTLFLGGGFFQRFGNGFASFALLFPIVESYDLFYNTTVFRISFGGFF